MTKVKPAVRHYRSPKRATQAAATREAVIAAAQTLFLAHGWAKTTIAGIASEAAVSSETIYAVFGSKQALLRELISRAVRGADPATALIEQEAPKRIAAEADQAQQVDLFARDIASVLMRVAPLMDVVRVAAGADAALAELYLELHKGRRRNLEWFADVLARHGRLRDDMDAARAADILWRLASPDLFLLMQRVETVSLEDYADWLATSLKLLLLRH